MDTILKTIRNIFLGVIILFVNIPLFWSFNGFINFVKDVARYVGIEV